MDDKHNQVAKWLSKLSPNGYPSYELCEKTIDILHNMMRKNQQYDEYLRMEIEDADAKRLGYECEAKRIEHLLSDLDVTPSSLSTDVSGKLKALVNVTQVLDAQNTSTVRIPVGMCELLKENSQAKISLEKYEACIALLTQQMLTCQKLKEKLEKTLHLIKKDLNQQDEELRNNEEKINLSKSETGECQKKVGQFESTLASNGYSLEITHEELFKQYQHLKTLEKEFLDLKTILDGYHDLPPDVSQAVEKLSAAKVQLNEIEINFRRHLNE